MITISISVRTAAFLAVLLLAGIIIAYDRTALGVDDPEAQIQGDVNCDQAFDSGDILAALREEAGLDPGQTEPCTDIGDLLPQSVGPQGPQGEQGPPGPAGPPGVNLFANVTASGEITTATAGTAVANMGHGGTGWYRVRFAQDVSRCAAVATIGGPGDGIFGWRVITNVAAGGKQFTDNDVEVVTYDPIGGVEGSDFHLIVVC
jgi:hypothetical protein